MLAHVDSYHHKRAEFADHNLYVTKYRDGELYAGGKYTNQSRGGTGVRAWADRKESVVDEDIVVWLQLALQHVTRVENLSIMPCEVIKMQLKPINFFDRNPALDVPPSKQEFNRSTLVAEQHQQPAVEGRVEEDGEVCCSSEL
ncbi:hypothetical protein IMSHALPRED_004458 [Imshaugia aleurites]|uniref:Amine oxidase n=1 Tax=Imshaugia aleurites TaxID=172621 RepID=A0A8H3FDJ6_9LECA|nr:hypothetical protein IMSHALPRED_004458 [Imshaugia aleurites]